MILLIRLLLILTLFVSSFAFSEELFLYPQKIGLSKGSVSQDQATSVLALKDQFNTDDDWDRFKDFTPDENGLNAVFKFNVPLAAIIDGQQASILVNYKGWNAQEQLWKFSVYNFKTKEWIFIGDNHTVANWIWTTLSFQIPGSLTNYIKNGHIKIQYRTNSDLENSLIDYFSILINSSTQHLAQCATLGANEKFSLIKNGCLRGANMYEGEQYASSSEVWVPNITADDLVQLRANHANYVNYSVPGPYDVNPPYNRRNDFFQKLDSLIQKAEANDLFILLSFRTGPGRGEGDITNDAGSNKRRTLFRDKAAQKAFINMWKDVALRYKGKKHIIGYEILVEPHDVNRQEWRYLAQNIINGIRTIDSDIPVLVSAGDWSSVDSLNGWKPLQGSKIIYTIHQYEPYHYTHENKSATWRPILRKLYRDTANWVTKYRKPVLVNEYGFQIFRGNKRLNKGSKFMKKQLKYLDRYQFSHAVWIWEVENDPDYDYQEFDFKENPKIFNSIKASWQKNVIFPSMMP